MNIKAADFSGWFDRNIRQPINNALDKNVRVPFDERVRQPVNNALDKNIRQPIQNNFVAPVNKVIDQNREQLIAPAKQLEGGVNYVTKAIPNHIKNEVSTGYNGFYNPSSLDRLNLLRLSGMLLGGLHDRWAHDSSTNADGTPNTDAPTSWIQSTWNLASDASRNMLRNLAFDSDMPGTTRLPFVGERKNSELANLSALPANIVSWSDILIPKSITSKLFPRLLRRKPVPIANMSQAKKYRLYKQIERQKAKLFHEYMSPKTLRKEFNAIVQDPKKPITFNEYWKQRWPQSWQEYVAKNGELSDKESLLFPWLKTERGPGGTPVNYRTGTGTDKTLTGDWDTSWAMLRSGKKFPKDPDAVIFRNVARYGPSGLRAALRTHRDNHWNSFGEQAKSLASDLVGDVASNYTAHYLPIAMTALGSRIHPAVGAGLSGAEFGLKNLLNSYFIYVNQRDALRNATGMDEKKPSIFNMRSFWSDKTRKFIESLPDVEDMKRSIDIRMPSDYEIEHSGVYIPGKVNPKVQ